MQPWPRIHAAASRADSDLIGALLWSIMRTTPARDGHSCLYDLVDAHLRPEPTRRRRPVVDEMLGQAPASQIPRALIRHDVDSWAGMEQWVDWHGRMNLPGVYLLRSPLPEGTLLPRGATATYPFSPPDYRVEDGRVCGLVEAALAEGSQFGLHYASASPEVAAAESRRLREALHLAGPLPAGAHWLFSSGLTLEKLDESGIRWDFSLMDYDSYATAIPDGEPTHPGFLTGTTHPHLLFSPARRRWLDLLGVPGGLEEVFVAGQCPTRPERPDLENYLEMFRRHRGLLVLVWHSQRFDLVEHLERLVDKLLEMGFTFVTATALKPPPRPGPDSVADPRA